MIRVLLVDDQALFREGLSTLLSVYPDVQVVGEAGNGEEALSQVAVHQPDVVLMDLRMPVLDGAAATRRIRSAHPHIQVIVLTTFDDDEHIFDGLRAGAVGYLLKDVPSPRLVEAIRTAARGESFLHPSVATRLVAEFNRLTGTHPSVPSPAISPPSSSTPSPLLEPLSERELEILRHLAQGASNREIANTLYITEGTVKNHITNILGKLGVRDRTQAALKAREMGMI